MNKKQALDEAIRRAGTASALADLLGVRPQAVHKWKKAGQAAVIGGRCIQIEKLTGVSRHDLRPDIYPRED